MFIASSLSQLRNNDYIIKHMCRVKSFLIILLLISPLCFTIQSYAQGQIQKEVRVIKPYTPTLSEANKISLLPEFNDTLRVNPNFGYVIYPKRFETDFKIDPIKPAKMVGMPIQKLYKSQLTLGAGNYLTPYMELSINQLRAKTTQLGFYFNHLSSSGKLKLENNKKVNAGYNDNLIKLYGKKIYTESVFEADISGAYNSLLYYGYDPDLHKDTTLATKENIQKIYSAGAGIKYYSMYSDSFHLNYKTELNYGLVTDYFKNTEHGIDFAVALNKKIGDQVVGGDLRIRYFSRTGSLDSANYTLVDVNPWYSKSTNEWKFLLGLNLNYDQSKASPSFYPRATFEFNIVPEVLIPYLGITGYQKVNNYRKILFENPFLAPGTTVSNTNHLLIGYAGLKGRYSNKMSFNLKGSYETIDSMYFFVNDSTNILRNQFVAVYDNVSLLSLSAELSWHQSEKLQFLMKANYFKYQLDMLKYAWHRPSVEVSLSADYNLRNKILVGTDIFFTGKRYAPGVAGNINELKGYLDANLSVEYRYTKVLSFFVRFNNLTASKYQIWNQYPAQRFQFLAGFSYAL
jgi:hypothetical protein